MPIFIFIFSIRLEPHTLVTVYVWLFSTMIVGRGQYVVYIVTTSVTVVSVPLVVPL